MSFSSGILLAILALSVLWDLTLFRIPNWLLLIGWLLGFTFSLDATYLLKSILPIAFLWIPWRIGIFGAGDLKLLAVVCGYLGVDQWFPFFFYFLLSAGSISLLRLILNSSLRIRFSYFFNYCGEVFVRKRKVFYEGPEKERASIPLAVPMFMGYLCLIL